MRQINRQRHQFGGLVAGIAEHQALVTGPLVEIQALAFGHTLGNVRRLLVVSHQHRTTLVVDAVIGIVVADAFEGLARHPDVVDVRVGRDLARQNHQAGVAQGFGGHSAEFVLG